MKELKAIYCLIILQALLEGTIGQGRFEDADRGAEYSSSFYNEDQQYDIRHNIPGEPEIDYPVYSVAPKTGFSCENRHDGYYADVASRCQVFRICTETDLTGEGFPFLCPNGTLFSQELFVCDWYQNVDCEASEAFYFMNENIGKVAKTSEDMMKVVREMVDYPINKITNTFKETESSETSSSLVPKLKPTTSVAVPPPTRRTTQNTQRTTTDNSRNSQTNRRGQGSRDSSRRTNVVVDNLNQSRRGSTQQRTHLNDVTKTEQNTDFRNNRNNYEEGVRTNTRNKNQYSHENRQVTRTRQRTNTQIAVSNVDEDEEVNYRGKFAPPGKIYVSSLGELSTDRESTFDPHSSYIVGESSNEYDIRNAFRKPKLPLHVTVDREQQAKDLRKHSHSKTMGLGSYSIPTKQKPSERINEKFNFAEKINDGLNTLTDLSHDNYDVPHEEDVPVSHAPVTIYSREGEHNAKRGRLYNLAENINSALNFEDATGPSGYGSEFDSDIDSHASQESVTSYTISKINDDLFGHKYFHVPNGVPAYNSDDGFRAQKFLYHGSGFTKSRQYLPATVQDTSRNAYLPPVRNIPPQQFTRPLTFSTGIPNNLNTGGFQISQETKALDNLNGRLNRHNEFKPRRGILIRVEDEPEPEIKRVEKKEISTKYNNLNQLHPNSFTKLSTKSKSSFSFGTHYPNTDQSTTTRRTIYSTTTSPITTSVPLRTISVSRSIQQRRTTTTTPSPRVTTTITPRKLSPTTTTRQVVSSTPHPTKPLTPAPILYVTQLEKTTVKSIPVQEMETEADNSTETPAPSESLNASKPRSRTVINISSNFAARRQTVKPMTYDKKTSSSRQIITTRPMNLRKLSTRPTHYSTSTVTTTDKQLKTTRFNKNTSTSTMYQRPHFNQTNRYTIPRRYKFTTDGRKAQNYRNKSNTIYKSNATTETSSSSSEIPQMISNTFPSTFHTSVTTESSSGNPSFTTIAPTTDSLQKEVSSITQTSPYTAVPTTAAPASIRSQHTNSNHTIATKSVFISPGKNGTISTSMSYSSSSSNSWSKKLRENKKNNETSQNPSMHNGPVYVPPTVKSRVLGGQVQKSTPLPGVSLSVARPRNPYVPLPGTTVTIAKSEEGPHITFSNAPIYTRRPEKKVISFSFGSNATPSESISVSDKTTKTEKSSISNSTTITSPTPNPFLPFPTISPGRKTETTTKYYVTLPRVRPLPEAPLITSKTIINYDGTIQRRIDTFDLDDDDQRPVYRGVSSYNVPLKSVGRLPFDIQRRRR